jgi:predicted dehydrogenase
MVPLIRAGTVGVGRLGREHVRVLANLPGIRLSGVYDQQPERGEAESHPYGVRQAASLNDLIASCDLITVATPTSTHLEVARRVIEAGVACLVEKPLCATAAEAEALVDVARKRGVPLGVGHIERYNPAYAAFRRHPVVPRFIEAHRLAPFVSRGTDVAVVFDLMIHDIDLVLHLVGQLPRDVRAAGAAVVSQDLDICNARLEFDGAVANLTASRISTATRRRFRVFSESAYAVLDLREKSLERYRLFDSAEAHASAGAAGTVLPLGERGQVVALEKVAAEPGEMLRDELADFVAAVRTGTPPPVPGEDGLQALRVAERVHASAHELLRSVRPS